MFHMAWPSKVYIYILVIFWWKKKWLCKSPPPFFLDLGAWLFKRLYNRFLRERSKGFGRLLSNFVAWFSSALASYRLVSILEVCSDYSPVWRYTSICLDPERRKPVFLGRISSGTSIFDMCDRGIRDGLENCGPFIMVTPCIWRL